MSVSSWHAYRSRVEPYHFMDDGIIPNHPILPMLVYPGVFAPAGPDPVEFCVSRFEANRWRGIWRNGIYDFAHYHSTAHEVLGICQGGARLRLGGSSGRIFEVRAGDVLILPAGTGHQNLGATGDLAVVGAYPFGQEADLCRGQRQDSREVRERIAKVPLPGTDPVFGVSGPLLEMWRLETRSA